MFDEAFVILQNSLFEVKKNQQLRVGFVSQFLYFKFALHLTKFLLGSLWKKRTLIKNFGTVNLRQ